VRPGITGWAQINGGNLVTTEEKGALDDWYVRNASFWLDLRIALYTLIFLFTGERRSERAVREANVLQQATVRQQGYAQQKSTVVKGPEPSEIRTAHAEAAATLPIRARAKKSERQQASWTI
jgi:hypothetical protein